MLKLAALVAAILLSATVCMAQAYRAPRAADGHPDLQGTWTNSSLTRLERPANFSSVSVSEVEASAFERAPPPHPVIPGDDVGQGETEWWEMGATLARIGGRARASWVVEPADGRLPFTEAGRRAVRGKPPGFDGPEARPLTDRCLGFIGSPAGPPMLNAAYNANYQIIQTRDHVAILTEANHALRIIRLDGVRLPPAIRPWMGDSIGRWVGDTLVVETVGLRAEEASRGGPFGALYSSPQAHIVERFTRVAADQILYEFTIDDPATYTRPWRAEMAFRPSSGPIFEFACHEGNYSMAGILAGARRAEADARAAAAR